MLDLLQQYLSQSFETFQQSGYDLNSFKPFLRSQVEIEASTNCIPDSIFKLLLTIPTMLGELRQMIYMPDLTLEMRALAGGIYSYVFNPFDYINEEIVGFLGFVDDALIVFYGMKLIEAIDQEKRFSTTHDPNLIDAVQECEKLLAEDLVAALKAYPQQISGVLSTANLTPTEPSYENEMIAP